MKKHFKTIAAMALATLQVSGPVAAAEIEGPAVFWKISMYGNPRALTTGMEALAAKAAGMTGGKFRSKFSMLISLEISAKTLTD
jgi:hypothetical protein